MDKTIDFSNKTILITGAAGFIGANLAKRVCEENPNAKVIGFDSVNDYYDVKLKERETILLSNEFTKRTKFQIEIDGKTYNLNGQQVTIPQKGLYIRNGKKVIIH